MPCWGAPSSSRAAPPSRLLSSSAAPHVLPMSGDPLSTPGRAEMEITVKEWDRSGAPSALGALQAPGCS